MTNTRQRISALFEARFGETPAVPTDLEQNAGLGNIAGRGSCRSFSKAVPSQAVIRTICAAALCAPSKSDLQQRDILIVEDQTRLKALKDLLAAQEWIEGAPCLLLFLANNRRQRRLHEMHALPFANDHLDAFFNASLDAGIALAFCMAAAEAAGLGCCPISTIRNHLPATAELFELPDHVFPVAALAVGFPDEATPHLTQRLALRATVHTDRFRETTSEDIEAYDHRRLISSDPAPGTKAWSEAKALMYAKEQRTDFGDFARSIGFVLR